jgi:TusA-related sulfurtransferase
MNNSYDQVLDLRGVQCPMPLVEGAKAIKALKPGEVLKIFADYTGSRSVEELVANASNVEQIANEKSLENDNDLYIHFLRLTE